MHRKKGQVTAIAALNVQISLKQKLLLKEHKNIIKIKKCNNITIMISIHINIYNYFLHLCYDNLFNFLLEFIVHNVYINEICILQHDTMTIYRGKA